MAQNVYSLNVVGYVNATLKSGFNLVANPLDFDGTGANNTIVNVLSSNLPLNTTVYTFKPDGSGYDSFSYISIKGAPPAWSPATGKINPGQGAWIKAPSNTNATFVGTVLQGSLQNTNVRSAAGGFSFVGSMAPLTGGVQQVLGYVPTLNDVVYRFKADQSGYDSFSYISIKGAPPAWSPPEPGIDVAQGFWIKTAQTGETWTKNFTVQ
jgi:hypothetical protein